MTSLNPGLIQPTLPGGLGITESQIHAASGLRSFMHEGVFVDEDKCVATANIATTTSWKVLPLETQWGTYSQTASPQTYVPNRTRLPFPCTPCITYRQTNGTPAETQIFSVRVYGRDQFGTSIQEQINAVAVADATHTPGVPTSPYVRRTRLWCAKVFSAIERVEYIATCQSSSDYIDVGVYWDFDYSGNAAPYENYVGQANQGVGTLGLINAYTPGINSLIYPDFMGLELVNLAPQVFPVIGTSSVGSSIATYSVGSTGLAISNFSVANPTVVTCAAHGVPAWQNRFRVRIFGDSLTGKTYLNGEWTATYVSATTFSIPANVASTHSSYTGITCYVIPAITPLDRPVPTIIAQVGLHTTGATAPNPLELNGYHLAFWNNSLSVSPKTTATTAGTGGYVHALLQPAAAVQAYNSSASGIDARGGFRFGTNASGYVGTPHKWNLYKAFCGSSATIGGVGSPIIPTDGRFEVDYDADGLADPMHFPWSRGDRIGFKAYYHTSYGNAATNNRSSYGHAP